MIQVKRRKCHLEIFVLYSIDEIFKTGENYLDLLIHKN
jgi:hypothetical protein